MGWTMLFSFEVATTKSARKKRAREGGSACRRKIPAHDADGDAFDRQRRLLGVYDNRRKGGVLRDEHDFFPAPLQALDGDLVAAQAAQTRDDDLSRARFAHLVHGEPIAVENAGVAH